MADGGWVPEFPGQRPPFQPGNSVGRQVEEGNELAATHRGYSPRYVEPLAQDLLEVVLAEESTPAHVKSATYRLELLALCRAEAQVQLVTEWLVKQAEGREDGMPDLGDERVRSAYLLLHRAESRGASARTRLGMTPVSAARLGKNVAQGHAANADVALRMAQLHELEKQGWTPPADWGDGDGGEGS